ncbi:DUF3024 domain-containing protein [Glutamicibacter sp. 287]|uniref:DUF3024 domain-containing protein n=2 Tax=Glutamicibacter TaxID=1742989 RepID=UPI004034C2FB
MIPEPELACVRMWCAQQIPESVHDRLQLVCEEAPHHVTILESRPPWDGRGDWIRSPIARLRYVSSTGLWSLYWRDRNLKFHKYEMLGPTAAVQEILDFLSGSQDPIFFG